MAEIQIGKFNLLEVQNKLVTGTLKLNFRGSKNHLHLGNPDTDQYLGIDQVKWGDTSSEFKISEKIAYEEIDITSVVLEEGKLYQLDGTSLLVALDYNPNSDRPGLRLVAPPNVFFWRTYRHK